MKTLIVFILLFAVLFALNPGMDDFKAFAEERSGELLARELGGGELGDLLSGVGGRLTGRYIDRVTERDDYLVASTYTIDLDGPDREGEEWRFLGVAGQFVEIGRPASLRDER